MVKVFNVRKCRMECFKSNGFFFVLSIRCRTGKTTHFYTLKCIGMHFIYVAPCTLHTVYIIVHKALTIYPNSYLNSMQHQKTHSMKRAYSMRLCCSCISQLTVFFLNQRISSASNNLSLVKRLHMRCTMCIENEYVSLEGNML